jgi:hypothetical protein
LNQNRTSPWHTVVKITSIGNRGRILKDERKKKQITYAGKFIKI